MVANLLHILTVLLFPPLLLGVINRTKAFFGGRQGPPLLQPYYDILRLLRKGTVQSTSTTWLFRVGPVASLVAALAAAVLIPLGDSRAPVSFMGDILLFAYILALGRFFLALSALDSGSSFEGMGAAREVTFACLAEPAMFFCLLVLATVSQSLRMEDLFSTPVFSMSGRAFTPLLLVLLSWSLLTLAENCRIPFDDPNTHLELTMIHEVMVLDHSGPMFAMIQFAAAIKLFLFTALGIRLLVPFNLGSIWLQWSVFVVCVLGSAVAVGIVESVMARLRMPKVPHMLATAGVVAAFAFILLVMMP